jgi:hypothetical protein
VLAAQQLLRDGLLEDVSVLVASAAPPLATLGLAVDQACAELGARVHMCTPELADGSVVEAAVTAAVAVTGRVDLLVVDGHGFFVGGDLHGCLDTTWNITRAVVNGAFLSPAEPSLRRIVYLAPSGQDELVDHADAARAGLENLARTLSIEWARHGITAVAVAPGKAGPTRSTADIAREVATLTAYLASPAGAYFSGCLLDLTGPQAGGSRGV